MTAALEALGEVTELRGAVRSGAALPLVAPRDEDALVELVRRARGDGKRVLPVGNGTSLSFTNLATDATSELGPCATVAPWRVGSVPAGPRGSRTR